MKIMISSNAPWCASGYGVQSNLLVQYLKKFDFEIVFLSNFGLMGSYLYHDGILYLPDEPGAWGNSTIRYHAEMQKPELIISLADWFVFDTTQWNHTGRPWINWTPIDLNVNKDYDRLQKFLGDSFGIVAMSQFGFNQVKKAGREPMAMIHHAIDPNVFKILDKEECKKIIGFEKDSFVIGMNMANKDASENRKAFEAQFRAAKKFITKHPELNTFIYINSEPSPKYAGQNLVELLKSSEIDLSKVIFTHPSKLNTYPLSSNEMAVLYNCFDILMNASSGEGFGVPIIEAQACGVPVLTHNATSMPELTHYGYKARSDKSTKINVDKYGHRFLPSVADMANGLDNILENIDSTKAEEVSLKIRSDFDIDRIGLQWVSLIKQQVNGQV